MPKGAYYEPTPLDFAILAKLPDKGVIGGLRFAGLLAKYLRDSINEGVTAGLAVSVNEVQSRLRSMHVEGLVEPFAGGTGGTKIWARTPKGRDYLDRKEEVLGL